MFEPPRAWIGGTIAGLIALHSLTLLLACGDGRSPPEKRPGLGESCHDVPCRGDLSCHENTCVTREERDAREDAATMKEVAATALPPVGANSGRVPFSVKVRRSKGNDAFAQCAADERLVGGGCDGFEVTRTLTSRPEGFSENDTLGARWRCLDHYTAFAMCMWIPPAEAPTRQ